jgi:hypothetical protein
MGSCGRTRISKRRGSQLARELTRNGHGEWNGGDIARFGTGKEGSWKAGSPGGHGCARRGWGSPQAANFGGKDVDEDLNSLQLRAFQHARLDEDGEGDEAQLLECSA